MAKAPRVSGASGASAPPATATSTIPERTAWKACPMAIAPDAHELAFPTAGPRTAQVDRHVARPGAPEDGRGERGRDRADATEHVRRVLLLAEGDAAQRRPDPDPGAAVGPIGIGEAGLA